MFSLTLEGREAAARGETKFKVFVYWNLHKHVWSVKALRGYAKGKVIAHSSVVSLAYPYGKVSEAGRQRVLTEKRKNVHAGLVGLFDIDRPCADISTDDAGVAFERITYNPYKAPTFTFVDSGETFTDGDKALLWTDEGRKARVTVRLWA
jgi:hypothetical protein